MKAPSNSRGFFLWPSCYRFAAHVLRNCYQPVDVQRYAGSANEVRLRIKLAQRGDARTLSQGLDGVEVAEAN